MQLVLRKKVELMQVWTLFMLNNDHRCVMSHIRAKVLQNVSITEDDLKVFKDYMNILDDLKVGFLITIIERRVDKELRK